ncbi:MAG TPA: polysaccharide deacetylase family protein [Spirochaetota bacterium]|nr:polysaccharide deacetylase family protein [Spirochaetota bacterium]HPI88192.1 polysaccharide deacetylase family protein [Spirochaetota bacterium]
MGKSLNKRVPFLLKSFCVGLIFFSFIVSARSQQSIQEQRAVHVLCYHAFIDNQTMYSFTPEETEKQISYFIQKGFRFITFNDVITGNYRGTKNIFVTIDDGNRSVYWAYFSVFKKHGIRPLLAIYPSIIGKKDYALTWDELKKLHREGCPVASHGYYHHYVNKKLYDSNRASFMREIFQSKAVLEKELKTKIDVFVYPYGVHSPITIEKAKEAGYRYAFAVQGGHLGPEHLLEGGMRLPRYLLTRSNAQGLLAYVNRDAERLDSKHPAPVAKKPLAPQKEKKKAPARPTEHAYLPIDFPILQAKKTSFTTKKETPGDAFSPVPLSSDYLAEVKRSFSESSYAFVTRGQGSLSGLQSLTPSIFKIKLKELYFGLLDISFRYYGSFMRLANDRATQIRKDIVIQYRKFVDK